MIMAGLYKAAVLKGGIFRIVFAVSILLLGILLFYIGYYLTFLGLYNGKSTYPVAGSIYMIIGSLGGLLLSGRALFQSELSQEELEEIDRELEKHEGSQRSSSVKASNPGFFCESCKLPNSPTDSFCQHCHVPLNIQSL